MIAHLCCVCCSFLESTPQASCYQKLREYYGVSDFFYNKYSTLRVVMTGGERSHYAHQPVFICFLLQ
jgi:hypothetical protein